MSHRAKFHRNQSNGCRHGDLTVLKMAAGAVKKPILHQRTKFRKDRSNRCGDIAIFVKMAAAAILDFQKFEILTAVPLLWSNMRHHAKFHQNRWNGRRHMAI